MSEESTCGSSLGGSYGSTDSSECTSSGSSLRSGLVGQSDQNMTNENVSTGGGSERASLRPVDASAGVEVSGHSIGRGEVAEPVEGVSALASYAGEWG